MVWQAHVYLQKAPNAPGPLSDLGIITLDGDAREGGRVAFLVDGNAEVGMIEHLKQAPSRRLFVFPCLGDNHGCPA
jgi:hypothetical protein